jgi:hypothetical protein
MIISLPKDNNNNNERIDILQCETLFRAYFFFFVI